MIVAFGNDDNSTEAFDVLQNTLSTGGTRFNRSVGYQGGNSEEEVTWHAKANIWSLLDAQKLDSRFWCCFGVQDPKDSKNLDISVEINPSKTGTNLRVAGAFARDAYGKVHLCHNGRIGGSQRGVNKTAFFDHYHGDLTEMAFGNKIVEVVDLGPIRSPDFPRNLGWFVNEVVRVKDKIKAEHSDNEPGLDPSRPADGIPGFKPEFSGVRKPYSPKRVIEARAYHGAVVDVLKELVKKLGFRPYNNRAIDLFLLNESNRPKMLFEVKTDVRKNSIYSAVGQLFLNGRVADHEPRLVLVVPASPNEKTRATLRKIGIDVLTYEWFGHKPVIPVIQQNLLASLCSSKSSSL